MTARSIATMVLAALTACSDDKPADLVHADASVGRVTDASARDGAAPRSEVDGSSASKLDASLDADSFRNDAGVVCCIPSRRPDCCMTYGGAKGPKGVCGQACDGMPWPGDPAWRLVPDAFGCPKWTSQGYRGGCCGFAPNPPDAGTNYQMCYPDL